LHQLSRHVKERVEWGMKRSRAAANYAIFIYIFSKSIKMMHYYHFIIFEYKYRNEMRYLSTSSCYYYYYYWYCTHELHTSDRQSCNWIKMNECKTERKEKARRLKKWIERIYYDIKIHNNHLYMSNVFSNNL
jgi:hypothetical protein